MATIFAAAGATLGLGFVYFLAAVPAGVAAGLPVWAAAVCAWCGYSLGSVVVAFGGEPLRRALAQRFRMAAGPDPKSLVGRAWAKGGLVGLGLVAPVTVGPQIGSLIALAMGSSAPRVVAAFSLGGIPWCVGFAVITSMGLRVAN